MQHMTLKIASINHPPYIILNETRKGIWEITGGVDAYIINILQQKFCFKYTIVLPPEKEWGRLKEGRWTGVTGMVYRNEVDLGISNIMITEERLNSVILSVPYNSDGWVLCSLAPKASENKHAVMHPFELEVWCALFVSILISSFLLFSLQILRSRFRKTPILSWRNTLWNVVAALCQEDVKLSRMKSSALTYFIVWIFSAMILQVSYGGTLIGFLTFPTMEHSIDSLEELAEAIQNKEIKVSIKKYSMAQRLLGDHDKYGVIFSESLKSDPNALVSSHAEGFQGVLSKEFVFVGNEYGVIYDIYLVDFTKLQTPSILGRSYVAVTFAKKFQYVKDFNIILRRLTERGLINKWKSDLLERRHIQIMFLKREQNSNIDLSARKIQALKITQLQGAFLLLVIGHFLATSALIAEIMYVKYRPKKSYQFPSRSRKRKR